MEKFEKIDALGNRVGKVGNRLTAIMPRPFYRSIDGEDSKKKASS